MRSLEKEKDSYLAKQRERKINNYLRWIKERKTNTEKTKQENTRLLHIVDWAASINWKTTTEYEIIKIDIIKQKYKALEANKNV